jgi:hypothetical protein
MSDVGGGMGAAGHNRREHGKGEEEHSNRNVRELEEDMMENSRSGNRTGAEGANNKKGVKTEQEKKIMWVMNNLYPRHLTIPLEDFSNFSRKFATQLRRQLR